MKHYFTNFELRLWGSSAGLIIAAFSLFDRANYLTLVASLIGVTSLVLNAKGNPIGQGLMILFSLIYGVISYSFAYYGEMVTYLGMTMPMAVASLITWLRNPYKGNRAEVTVDRLPRREYCILLILTVAVTALFYFVLKVLNTTNLFFSTLSVTTSFLAVYLTFRRSPLFALAYAANDVVLIVLWSLAALEDSTYVSVIICFAVFLVNDLYGFISWRKMEQRQRCA